MVNALNKSSKKRIQEPTYKELCRHLPVFRWLAQKSKLSDHQMLALFTNLAQLGEDGKEIAQFFLDKHGHKVDVDELYEKCQGKPIATYESFALLGYDGYIPEEYDSPIEELLDLKKSKDMANRGLYYSERGQLRINANTFAAYVLHRLELVFVLGQGFFLYEASGKWRPIDDVELGKRCRDILHEVEDGIWIQSWHGEYMAALRLEVPQLNSLDRGDEFINVQNGMLDLRTMNLRPHAPEYYSTIQTPIRYNSNATCPKFEAFLHSIFEGARERIDLMQEIMGYVLTKDMRLQKAFIFHGIGSNGKSVLADIIRHIAGGDNVSHAPLNKLGERFGLDNLPGKTVNISTENELGEKHLNTQNFKAITGADTINVERKYQDSFSCELFCKLVVLVNRLPTTKDHSHGFYRRLVIVPFNRVFTEAEQDRDLLSKLLGELEGILAFALRGYKRLIENNHRLTICSAAERALNEYKEEQNPVLVFMRKELTFADNASVKRKEVYSAFQVWARQNEFNEFSSMGRQRFWDLFRAGASEVGYDFLTKKIKGEVFLDKVALNGTGRPPRNSMSVLD